MSQISRSMASLLIIIVGAVAFAFGYLVKPTTIIRYEQPPPPEVITEKEPIEKRLENLERGVSGITTLVYGAIGAALVSALAAIVSLMQISRRIAGG